jgi:hypothetical protein
MPQTLTPEWVQELGEEAEGQWSRLLHTLGNLTLTKYNAPMSNNPYADKQKVLAGSHFELNHYFAEVERWSPVAIRNRGHALASRALTIWRDIGETPNASEAEKQSSEPPVRIRFRHAQQPVKNWKDAFIKLLTHFDASSPGLLLRIATEQTLNAVIALNGDRFRLSKKQIGDVFINTHASAASLQDWCRKVAKLGSISVEDFEFIKADEPSAPPE